MKKGELLDNLVASHFVRSPILPLKKSFFSILAVTISYIALVLWGMGFRDDFGELIGTLLFNMEGAFLFITISVGLLVSLGSVRPGVSEIKLFQVLSMVLWALSGILVIHWIFRFMVSPSAVVFNLEYGTARLIEVALIIVVPLVWLVFQLSKGVALRPHLTLFSTSISMAALSTLCLHLGCCPFHPAQVLIWHFLPAFLIAYIAISVVRGKLGLKS